MCRHQTLLRSQPGHEERLCRRCCLANALDGGLHNTFHAETVLLVRGGRPWHSWSVQLGRKQSQSSTHERVIHVCTIRRLAWGASTCRLRVVGFYLVFPLCSGAGDQTIYRNPRVRMICQTFVLFFLHPPSCSHALFLVVQTIKSKRPPTLFLATSATDLVYCYALSLLVFRRWLKQGTFRLP